MKLTDFFLPLNLYTLAIYLLLFIFFDILGTFVKGLITKSESTTRIIYWLIGLGIFIFIWFLLSLKIPYEKEYILLSIGILSLISLPSYIKNNSFKELTNTLLTLKVPILIILPFLPAVFVKASLPPYYGDEMAYHFIPPYTLLHLEPIKYIGGLYADLPRLMNMFYEIIFSLTKTYSIARLFHFTILATSMLYSYRVLSKNLGWFTGFLFVFLFFSLPQDIVLTATLGYIDVAAYSFLLIAIISGVAFIFEQRTEYLLLSSIFWAMNLATKYTGISSFVLFSLVFLGVLAINKKIKSTFNRKVIQKLLIVILIFGGYWYVKNLILFGNPIFPFLFNCWGTHIEPCPQTGGFFGDWTTKINLANSYLILSQLFVKNKIIHLLILLTPFLAFFIKDLKQKVIVLFLFLVVVLDLVFLKYFSGFLIRYHQHMQLYLLIGLCIALTATYKNRLIQFAVKTLLVILVIYSSGFYLHVVKYSNSLNFLNWNEINYSLGKIDTNGWINQTFPNMKHVLKWCEEGDLAKPKLIARYDPDLIWFNHDGLSRSFILNCNYSNPVPSDIPVDALVPYAVKNMLNFYLISTSKCIEDEKVEPKFTYERPYQTNLRKVNIKLVCNSVEIVPNLYYFDYATI